MTEVSDDTRIPVTLITGFLGAGKTTLLNHLVRDPKSGRIAVIMNELGDVGLDHDLIEESVEETILMEAGCICCSIRGDLIKTLGKLVARRNRGELTFDRVVIETTGIADPGPILHSLVVDQFVGQCFRMDGVVVLADAATGLATLDTQFEAVQQVAMADLIVISKVDLVSPIELSLFEARIDKINSTAKRIEADHGRVRGGALFDLSAMRGNVMSDGVSDWLGLSPPAPDPFMGQKPLAGLSGLGLDKQKSASVPLPQVGSHAPLAHRICSASIEVEGPIPADVFDFWLDTLIALKGSDILRIKGIVHVEGVQWPFVFHGVQHIFEAPVPLKSWAGQTTTSRIVVIARDMEEAELQASLQTLRMRPLKAGTRVEGMLANQVGMLS